MKILHITYGFNGGGVGFVIANYCARKPMDGIQFDIVGEDIGKKHLLHETFEQAGFGVYYVTPKKENLLKNLRQVFHIIRKGHYDGVHVHFEEWSFIYLMIAKICGVQARICHAHMAYMTGADQKPHYKLFRQLLNRYATLRLACSRDAGEHLYGNNPFHILNNAIDSSKFKYNDYIREKVRKDLAVQNTLVIAVVGRLSYQKNPQFTVKIFEEIHKAKPESLLLFIGQGELEGEARNLVAELGLKNSVRFLGIRTDVPDLLQAADAFVLPSRFEGLGIVYVEAQAAGLPTYATDAVVPKEACISEELMHYIPQDATEKNWADIILKTMTLERKNVSELIIKNGYDIDHEIVNLERLYLNNERPKNESF